MLLNGLEGPLQHNGKYLRVGQAQLRILAGLALSVDHGEVFRMRIEKLRVRNIELEGMDKAIVPDAAAVAVIVGLPDRGVHPPLHGKVLVRLRLVPVGFPVFKGRNMRFIQLRQLHATAQRHLFHAG